jgi:hypothetical protein
LSFSQINRNFATKNSRLKQYRDVVWDAMKKFDEFPREENQLVDSLDVSTFTLQHFKEIGLYKVEVTLGLQ